MSPRMRRSGAWFAAGLAAAVVIAAVALAATTRSDWGRGVILRYTLQTLGGRLNGSLVVDRLDGNIFTGARLYGISLRGLDDTPLLVADSAFVEYNLPTFLGGDVVIERLVLFSPDALLRRLPGDSLWNYQKILQDTTSAPDPATGRATRIERLELVEADALVLLPWEPEADSPAEREREVELALADTSRLMVERVAGGFLRTIRLDVEAAVIVELTIAPDERGGTFLAVESATGEIMLYSDEPLRLAGLAGELALREGVMRYEAPVIRFPGSALQSGGVVDLTGEEPRYDLVVSGRDVEFADLQWLYPPLPERGSVSTRLWLETRPEGLLFLVRDAVLVGTDTRIQGDFGMIVGDTLRFVEAELTADPLSVEFVQSLLPADLPVEGLRVGSVEIRAPAS